MGHALTTFIHPGDENLVRSQIEKAKKEVLQKSRFTSERISFRCRMRERNQPRTEVITYQVVQVVGNLTFSFDGATASAEQEVQAAQAEHQQQQQQSWPTLSRKRTHDGIIGGGNGIVMSDDAVALGDGDTSMDGSLVNLSAGTVATATQHMLFKVDSSFLSTAYFSLTTPTQLIVLTCKWRMHTVAYTCI